MNELATEGVELTPTTPTEPQPSEQSAEQAKHYLKEQ